MNQKYHDDLKTLVKSVIDKQPQFPVKVELSLYDSIDVSEITEENWIEYYASIVNAIVLTIRHQEAPDLADMLRQESMKRGISL